VAMTSEFQGRWALVTGASGGIGAAIAIELAERGAKLILTGRERERLEALAGELRTKGTETMVVVADLNDSEAPQLIFSEIECAGLTVEILVNCAGLIQRSAFHLCPMERELSQVRVHCEAVVRLTRLILPKMVELRRGWVMIVASVASFEPMAYFATYAATKAFQRYFALGLAAEVARHGVKVTAVCPGTTESDFHKLAGIMSLKGVQKPTEVARIGIDALQHGQQIVQPNPHWKMRTFLVRLLPVRLITTYAEKRTRPGVEKPA
jgi:uncharacterized protein